MCIYVLKCEFECVEECLQIFEVLQYYSLWSYIQLLKYLENEEKLHKTLALCFW